GRSAACRVPAPSEEISRRGCPRKRRRLGGSFNLATFGQWNYDLDCSAAALRAGPYLDGASYQLGALAHSDDAESRSQRRVLSVLDPAAIVIDGHDRAFSLDRQGNLDTLGRAVVRCVVDRFHRDSEQMR